MVIDSGNNITLVAAYSVSAEVTTDPVPVMDARTAVQLTANVHSFVNMGTAVGLLEVTLEGSNDGQTYQSIDGIADISLTGAEAGQESGETLYSYVRAKTTLSFSAGAAGDWSAVTFDVHCNFTQR